MNVLVGRNHASGDSAQNASHASRPKSSKETISIHSRIPRDARLGEKRVYTEEIFLNCRGIRDGLQNVFAVTVCIDVLHSPPRHFRSVVLIDGFEIHHRMNLVLVLAYPSHEELRVRYHLDCVYGMDERVLNSRKYVVPILRCIKVERKKPYAGKQPLPQLARVRRIFSRAIREAGTRALNGLH